MTLKPTTAQGWKKSPAGDPTPKPQKLPSGNICLMKRPGVQAFITAGIIPNTLMEIVQRMLKDAQGGKTSTADQFAEELMGDPEKLKAAFDLADSVCVDVVVDPPVMPVPEDDEERDPELLYVDEVDLDDKMFILQLCMGGTSDIDRFREEQDSPLGSVSSS